MKKTDVLSLVSFLLFVIFIFLAVGSFGILALLDETGYQKETRNDSIFVSYSAPTTGGPRLYVEESGPHDSYGRRHGEWTREDSNGRISKGPYIQGKRHGWHRNYDADGSLHDSVYYEQGWRTDPPSQSNIVSSFPRSQSSGTGYNIVQYESPWFIFKMWTFGIDGTQVESFISAIESRIDLWTTDPPERAWFSEYTWALTRIRIDEADDTLALNYYEIIRAIGSTFEWLNDELRLAVIERYREGAESTFDILKQNYPGYLDELFAFDPYSSFTEDMIKEFTDYLDTEMDSEAQPDPDDPDFLDIVDELLRDALNAAYFDDYNHIVDSITDKLLVRSSPVYQAVKAAYITVSVDDDDRDRHAVPDRFVLEQNYPNPFNPTTVIRYGVPEQAHVQLSVYNSAGQLVGALVDKMQATGYYEVTFDASSLPSGVYIYRMHAGEYVESKKLVYVK